ncbi:hypothetical protein P8935_05080 [Telmatobacter sp. DSM 110680]|uniref:Peptidase S1 domain-containing protein n=1 Tax=Telmatobacter sp. DSM 110680 TaxID=3036704 RepID=A0AAU7DM06_9BACT
MSLIDLIQTSDDASAVAHALMLAQALLDGPPDFGPRSFCYSSPHRGEISDYPSMPFGARFGVMGVGIVDEGTGLIPAVLKISGKANRSLKLHEDDDVVMVVKASIRGGFDILSNARIINIPPPEFEAVPGDSVSAALIGTAGVQINWGNGDDGILTAGHVGKPAGSTAKVGSINGSVDLSLDPTNNGKTPQADVAVIRLPAPVASSQRIGRTTTAGPKDSITVRSRSGKMINATIMGQMQWLWMPSSNCTCGHVYMTTAHVTAKGDSGAPALKSTDLIGHVIGASKGMTTYIQQIDYQLQEIRNQSGFSSAVI